MSKALFPTDNDEEHTIDMAAFLARHDAAVFIAVRPDDSVCGFVEVGARSIADGCSTSPVGYIEAWYVDPDVRRAGYGRALLEAAEAWAVEQGYREMASDALLDNDVSHEAHRRSGYVEVDRVITYRKPLPERR
jgi:aminoglycoside 6'-N-acetyltransferase I